MADTHPRILLVEGKQDVRVIPQLIEANGINWGTRKNPIVFIRDYDGYQRLVDPDVISTELQASGLTTLGIMLDADENPLGRWQSIRNASLRSIPDIPEDLPEDGLIHTTPNGIKFGVWIMPDNKISGMLETFLTCMIPTESEALWQFAQAVVQEAKNKGALLTDFQLDKANIYTWLAWQNPPGRQLHQAIMERILNPNHPNAQRFVTWFITLYGLA
ncbi:MAG: DUF3226 domain-containing protein [Oculatellaceae cyanobacterium bins.114]|nr:DUF3226 domain-containing protein [Oculatellaceae cyanobacterium bins.114]